SAAWQAIAAVFGGPTTCQTELYAPAGAEAIRCRDCGTDWPVAERRAWLLQHSRDYLLTAAELCRALPHLLGRPLNVKTVRTWATGGRLTERGRTDDGRPLYQVGEVTDLALRTAQRHRQPS